MSFNVLNYLRSFYPLKIIATTAIAPSNESVTIPALNVSSNNTLTSTSSSSSMSSSTTRLKFSPSVTPNPKVKKRGSSFATSDSTKVKKSAHAGNVQNINSSREALSQEGSDQQVSVDFNAAKRDFK